MSDNAIQPIDVSEELSKSFLDYSMSVIISRALPDARDGLKPSQRRILYAMRELNLVPSRSAMKCAKICGDTSGNYHPHGEAVIYPTLVNMGQHWTMRERLIEGQGNFGSVEGDPPAAMRYTEARLTHLGTAMMEDLDKNTVNFQPNYDERLTEPVVLPAAFPNLLINGGTGIAVGMATNLPPHNLGEVVDAICAQIDNPAITLPELMQYIKGPDFPVNCELRGLKGIEEYFRTGRGSVRLRGKMEIVEDGTRTRIIIRECPHGVNRAVLEQRIAELVNEKVLTGISDMRNLSDENTCIEIDLKRDARPQVIVNQIFKLTQMETSYSANMLAIHEGRPKLLSLKEALDCYIEHRREVIMRRTRYLLGKAEERAEILEAYLLALGHLDDFIKLIRESKNRDEARLRIKDYHFTTETAEALGIMIRSQPSIVNGRYVFTDRQVNAILDLRLYQLTALERDKIKAEYDAVLEEICDLMDILAKEYRVLTIIKEELTLIKEKYASPRMTEIMPDAGEINIEDLIANESMIVSLTHLGYIKRTLASEYRVQTRGGVGVRGAETRTAADRDDDFIEHLFSVTAHDYLLFFTNTGRMYVERVYEIPEGSRSAKGRGIRNLLDLQPDENIAALLRLERRTDNDGNDITFQSQDTFIFFATRDGKVKKTTLSDYQNYRKGGLRAINLEEGNHLIGVQLTNGNNDVLMVTNRGMSIRFNENNVRSMGRTAAGVAGIRPAKDDHVVSLTLVQEGTTMLVAAANGLGKRTPFDDYRIQNRGGKGIITMKITGKTGNVVCAQAVQEDAELMLMTTGGNTIRIRVSEIRQTGRNAQGVKLLRMKDTETLRDIALVVSEPESPLPTTDESE